MSTGYSNYVVGAGTVEVGDPVRVTSASTRTVQRNSNAALACIGIAISSGSAGEEITVANDPSDAVSTRNLGASAITAGTPVFAADDEGVWGVVGPGDFEPGEAEGLIFSCGVARTNGAIGGTLLVSPIAAPILIPNGG
jgi:hypothetical protein